MDHFEWFRFYHVFSFKQFVPINKYIKFRSPITRNDCSAQVFSYERIRNVLFLIVACRSQMYYVVPFLSILFLRKLFFFLLNENNC